MTRLVLADDHVMLREALRRRLEGLDGVEVRGEATTAADLRRLLAADGVDMVILDLKLPDAHGFGLIAELKRTHPRCRIVVLTMFEQERYAVHAMDAGAEGFVIKGAPFVELVAAIRTVARGGTYVSPSLATGPLRGLRTSGPADRLRSLSRREVEVFGLLAGGTPVKEIANRLGVNPKTVSTYRHRLMLKLDLQDTADLVRFAVERGIGP